MRTLTSDELNYLVLRYLQESGFSHSSFTFRTESMADKVNLKFSNEIPPGSLISFIQKGVQYLEIEAKLKTKEVEENGANVEIKYHSPFELLLPNLKTKIQKVSKHSERKTKNRGRELNNSKNINSKNDSKSSSSSKNSFSHKNSKNSKQRNSNNSNSNNNNNNTNNNNNNNNNSNNNNNENNNNYNNNSKNSKTSGKQRGGNANQENNTNKTSKNNGKQRMEIEKTEPQKQRTFSNSDVTVLKGHTHEVFICAWSPTYSNILASGSGDSTARIWELPKRKTINSNSKESSPNFQQTPSSFPSLNSNSSSVSPNPSNSLVDNSNGKVKSIVLQHSLDIMNTSKDVTTLDWSGDGLKLATGSYDGKARIWTNKGDLLLTLDKHKGPIFSLKWNKRGDYLLSGSVDNTAIIWDTSNGKVKQQFFNHKAPTLDVDWRTDQSFATCSTDKMIYVCKLGESDPIREFKGHKDEVNAIRWDPSGSLLASCSDDFTAKIWSMKNDNCLFDLKDHNKEIYTIKWSPTGPGTAFPNKDLVLASASFDALIKIWDINKGKVLHNLTKHTDPVYSVSFSPNGDYLASGSFDRNLMIWSVKDGSLVKSFKGKGSIFEVCWNSTGDKVAACFSNSNTEDFCVCCIDFRV